MSKIELVRFDPYTPSSLELGEGDEVLAVDTKIYNDKRLPYLIVRRAKRDDDDVAIWTVTAHKLSDGGTLAPIPLTAKGKLFVFQRISDSGVRTGNYGSYLAWLVVVDCSGKRKPVQVTLAENGAEPFDEARYLGTFGNIEKLINVFDDRQS